MLPFVSELRQYSIVIMKVKLREITSEDADEVMEMVYLALWDAPDEPKRPRKTLQHPMVKSYYENWGKPHDLGFLAEIEGESIGGVTIRVKDSCTQTHADLPELCIGICEKHTGKGVGTKLMRAIIAESKHRYPGIRLGVHPRNERAWKLYERFGFKEYEKPEGQYPQLVLLFK